MGCQNETICNNHPVDVSLAVNFTETARERGKSIPVKAKMKSQRLLLCVQYYLDMGATKVVPVFDPYTKDPDAPKLRRKRYTKQQFVLAYGGTEQWDALGPDAKRRRRGTISRRRCHRWQ